MTIPVVEQNLPGYPSAALKAVASDGNQLIVCVGSSSVKYTADGGNTWASATLPGIATGFAKSIAFGGGVFVAVGNDGTYSCAWWSTDGSAWTKVILEMSSSVFVVRVIWTGARFIAAASNRMHTSTAGSSWATTTGSFPAGGNIVPSTLVWMGSQALVFNTSSSAIYTSTDGLSWATGTGTRGAGDFQSVAWNGSTLVAVATSSKSVATSATGLGTWANTEGMLYTRSWDKVIWAAGKFIAKNAVGSGFSVSSSATGIGATWANEAGISTTDWVDIIPYGAGIIAITAAGKFAASPAPVVITLPLTFTVAPVAAATVGLTVSVLPTAVASGVQPVADGQTSAAVWGVVVALAGVDVTDNIIGGIDIDAEEGAARVVDLTLRLPPGAVDLSSWTGRPVQIWFADMSTGIATNAMLLFSGVVDRPAIDLDLHTVKLACTDDLQAIIARMSLAQIEALVGGRYSPAIFDEGANAWGQFNDRLSTVTASVDRSAYGALRLTPWAAKVTPDISYDETTVLSGSLSTQIADRSGVVNRVVVNFGYRVPKIKGEGHQIAYDIMTDFGSSLPYWIRDGGNFLVRSAVESAISAAGGAIDSMTWTALPTTAVILPDSSGVWIPNSTTDPLLCLGFEGVVSFRYAQYVDERYTITVEAAGSVERLGPLAETMSDALSAEVPDVTAAESSAVLYQSALVSNPPLALATITPGSTTAATIPATSKTDRLAADAAMEALIDVAKVKIAGSHRGSSVSFDVPLNPAIDLDKTIAVSAGGLATRGKVRRVIHRMDAASAQAISQVELAISSVLGVGSDHPEDVSTTSTASGDGITAGLFPPIVTYDGAYGGTQEITVTFPEVEAFERQRAVVAIDRTVNATIAEDLFTITIG